MQFDIWTRGHSGLCCATRSTNFKVSSALSCRQLTTPLKILWLNHRPDQKISLRWVQPQKGFVPAQTLGWVPGKSAWETSSIWNVETWRTVKAQVANPARPWERLTTNPATKPKLRLRRPAKIATPAVASKPCNCPTCSQCRQHVWGICLANLGDARHVAKIYCSRHCGFLRSTVLVRPWHDSSRWTFPSWFAAMMSMKLHMNRPGPHLMECDTLHSMYHAGHWAEITAKMNECVDRCWSL